MSTNPLKSGLFAARYFIAPGDEKQYADTLYSLNSELSPQGILEETFAIEIAGATWRLHRCRKVEASFTAELDPMIDEKTEKTQKSVDRARAQAHLILRRSLAEFRTLQTGRSNRPVTTAATGSFCNPAAPAPAATGSFCNPAAPAPAATGSFCNPAAPAPAATGSFCNPSAPAPAATGSFCNPAAPAPAATGSFCNPAAPAPAATGSFCNPAAPAPAATGSFCNPAAPAPAATGSFCNPAAPAPAAPGSFCNPAAPAPAATGSFCNPRSTHPAVSNKIPRNAPCPCRSGLKYKKCCGGPAANALPKAA